MITYVYETIPSKEGEQPKVYEIKQSMKDAPLSHHPETGEPIRRVITGGYGLNIKNKDSGSGGHSCGAGCGCHN